MPSTGCFDDNFEFNMTALVAAIESAISAAQPAVSDTARVELTRMGSAGQDDATDARIMQQLIQTLSDTNSTDES